MIYTQALYVAFMFALCCMSVRTISHVCSHCFVLVRISSHYFAFMFALFLHDFAVLEDIGIKPRFQ